MAIVWQMAGKYREGMFDKAQAAFAALTPVFDSAPGLIRAQILANENSRQIQLLTHWQSHAQSVAFFREHGLEVTRPLAPYLEDMGTIVCSAITFDYSPSGGGKAGTRPALVPVPGQQLAA